MWERLMSVNFNFSPTVKFKCHACGRAMGPTDATCAGCRVRGAPELVNEGIAAVALPIMLGIAIAGTIVVALMMLTGGEKEAARRRRRLSLRIGCAYFYA
jgi:hypothetical protein